MPASFRSSSLEVFWRSGVLSNFVKLTGKHLCQSLFFNKNAGLRLWKRCFPVFFCEISKNTFFYRTLLVAASLTSPWPVTLPKEDTIRGALRTSQIFFWAAILLWKVNIQIRDSFFTIKSLGFIANLILLFLIEARIRFNPSWRGRYHIETSPLICSALQINGQVSMW